jgi:hypothetical protein
MIKNHQKKITVAQNRPYDNNDMHSQLDELHIPVLAEEITAVILGWPRNKLSGPEGLTGEFYQCFRELLLPDLLSVFNTVMENPEMMLAPLNDSHITLVQKKGNALAPSDFRPISIINGVQKLFSKVLAIRLKPIMGKLLLKTQTGFVAGRNIMHGFHYARKVIQAAIRHDK